MAHKPQPTLENLLGTNIMDDTVRAVCNWLYSVLHNPNIEIEGKIGLLIDRHYNSRLRIPGIMTAVPINPDAQLDTKFKSEVTREIFRHVNERIMNTRFRNKNHSVRHDPHAPKYTYKHTTQLDKLYYNGARVTTDLEGNVKACIKKQRLGNLNFLCPSPSLDFRLSASVENPVPLPKTPSASASSTGGHSKHNPVGHMYNDRKRDGVRLIRRKDRTSYFFEIWSVDMTTVKSYSEMVSLHNTHIFNALFPLQYVRDVRVHR